MVFEDAIDKSCKINCLRDGRRYFYHAYVIGVTQTHITFIDKNYKEFIYNQDQIFNIEILR